MLHVTSTLGAEAANEEKETLEQKDWAGILPAITTPFQTDLSVDYETFGAQARWMVECGCKGIVALGSLGEAPTLTREEKVEILSRPGGPWRSGASDRRRCCSQYCGRRLAGEGSIPGRRRRLDGIAPAGLPERLA